MCIKIDKCTPLNSLLHLQGLFYNLFFSLTAKSAVHCLKLGAHMNTSCEAGHCLSHLLLINDFSKSLISKLEPDLKEHKV